MPFASENIFPGLPTPAGGAKALGDRLLPFRFANRFKLFARDFPFEAFAPPATPQIAVGKTLFPRVPPVAIGHLHPLNCLLPFLPVFS
jgi:hypothetical protein